MMSKLFKILIPALILCAFANSCQICKWDLDEKDFALTSTEQQHLGTYKIGDTIYFENNLGDIDSIWVLKIYEDIHKGSKCPISTPPIYLKGIIIGDTLVNKFNLIEIVKFPLKNEARYSVRFKRFLWGDSVLTGFYEKITVNNILISNCYKLNHTYPNRVIEPNDIEVVYWTDKYGLTAYTQKNGVTWLIRNIK